jgi:hypothetical protein
LFFIGTGGGAIMGDEGAEIRGGLRGQHTGLNGIG